MTTPLSGIRVLDFTHVASGPFATSILADFGADVIKIESSTRIDSARRLGPFKPEGPRAPEGSALFASINRNKRSVTINLKHPEGVKLASALAMHVDVVAENFSAGVMGRLGLGPEQLLARNQRLIYASMSGLGHDGPRAQWVSFNVILQALSGLMLATGRAEDPPLMVSNSWADFVAGLHGALVILAALARRGPEENGAWIDMSQYEANILPIGHLLLGSRRTGGPVGRWGNQSSTRAPQGCYRCRGDDEWCVISIGVNAEWEALVQVLDDASLRDPSYRSVETRQVFANEIDQRITAWTVMRSGQEVEEALQRAGIPASAVRNSVAVLEDLRRLAPSFRTVNHPVIGEMPLLPNPIHPSRSTSLPNRPAPTLGEHTLEVLGEFLGMSEGQVKQLQETGVLA